MADFGRNPRSSESLRGNDFDDFPLHKFLRNLNRTTSIGEAVKSFGQNFVNLR